MELPTTQAKKLIKSGNFKWIDLIVSGPIPSELAGNTDKTLCRLTEWLNEPTHYALSLIHI